MPTCPECHGAEKIWPGPPHQPCAVCGDVLPCSHRASGLAVPCPRCDGRGVVGGRAEVAPHVPDRSTLVDRYLAVRNPIAVEWNDHTIRIGESYQALRGAVAEVEDFVTGELPDDGAVRDHWESLIATLWEHLDGFANEAGWIGRAGGETSRAADSLLEALGFVGSIGSSA